MAVRALLPCAAMALCTLARVEAQGAFRALTIDQAVAEAVQDNLSLLAQRASLSIAEAGVLTARLRPNPVLSGGANSLDWLGTGFDDTNNAGPPEYAVRVDVPVERANKRALRTEVASTAKRVVEAQFADAVRRVKLDVALAAVDVLEAKAKLTLAQDNLQTLDRLVQLNERRLISGAIPQLEVTRSRVAMLQYRGSVRTAELALAQARLKLLALLGKKAGEPPVDIEDQLGLAPQSLTAGLPALVIAARRARPDLRAGQDDEARTQADLRLQLAQGKVDYTLGAEYRRQQGVNGRGNLLGLFVGVPLPLFNRNQGEIARASAEQEKATRTLAVLDNDVTSEVASAYEEFESARQLLSDIERDLLQPTTEARAGTTYTYQAGATSLLDVLDAQRAFNDTMDTYYSAQAAYRRARAKLALVVGEGAPAMTRRFSVWCVSLVVALVFTCAACGGSAPAAQAVTPAAPPVARDARPLRLQAEQIDQIRIEELTAHAPADTIKATGTVEFNADRMARILPPVQGQVQNLAVNVGSRVRRGQVLFELSSREVASAIAEHLSSQKDLDLSGKTLAMTQDLFEHQAASRIALQQAESEHAKAEAKVLQSEEALRVLGLDTDDLANPQLKSRIPVRAPLDGTVIERSVTDGQFVGPDVQPLLTLADLSNVWVIADVFERDLKHISIGQKADVTTAAYANERFSAQVNQIATVVDAQTRTAKVRFLVANRDLRLKPGMFTSATLYLPESPGALTIPVKAVFAENGRSYAYVQDANHAFARRQIETQPAGVERVRVMRGLAAGERVVSDGALLLRQLEASSSPQ